MDCAVSHVDHEFGPTSRCDSPSGAHAVRALYVELMPSSIPLDVSGLFPRYGDVFFLSSFLGCVTSCGAARTMQRGKNVFLVRKTGRTMLSHGSGIPAKAMIIVRKQLMIAHCSGDIRRKQSLDRASGCALDLGSCVCTVSSWSFCNQSNKW